MKPTQETRFRSRKQLTIVVGVTSFALILTGVLIFVRKSGIGWLADLFIAAGVFTALAGGWYLGFILEVVKAKEKDRLLARGASLVDLLDWRIADEDFKWSSVNKTVDHDLVKFLATSPLGIVSDWVEVLEERFFALKDSVLRVGYLVCDVHRLDQQVQIFEGWVFHVPELKEENLSRADFNRENLNLFIFSPAISVVTFSLIRVLLGRWWPQLSFADKTLIFAAVFGIVSFACLAYARNFTRPKFGGAMMLSPAYREIYEHLAKSSQIQFFRMTLDTNGLLIAVQPVNESIWYEHRGVLPIDGSHGRAFDELLEQIEILIEKEAEKKVLRNA